jgi:hypothetical protein
LTSTGLEEHLQRNVPPEKLSGPFFIPASTAGWILIFIDISFN